MAEETKKTIDEQKLEASRLMRKAERKMLADYINKLKNLTGLSQIQGLGYLKLLSETTQNLESQVASITELLKQRIKRLNNGWPNPEIRQAKADELRPDRKSKNTDRSDTPKPAPITNQNGGR